MASAASKPATAAAKREEQKQTSRAQQAVQAKAATEAYKAALMKIPAYAELARSIPGKTTVQGKKRVVEEKREEDVDEEGDEVDTLKPQRNHISLNSDDDDEEDELDDAEDDEDADDTEEEEEEEEEDEDEDDSEEEEVEESDNDNNELKSLTVSTAAHEAALTALSGSVDGLSRRVSTALSDISSSLDRIDRRQRGEVAVTPTRCADLGWPAFTLSLLIALAMLVLPVWLPWARQAYQEKDE